MRVRVDNITVTYGRDKDVSVLQEFSLSLRSGEMVSVVGPSGCGKSSLLMALAGLKTPTSGEIRFPDWKGPGAPSRLMAFQEHGLFPWLNVLDNICIGLEAKATPRGAREARAMDMLERIGLAHVAQHKPGQLSGGMRQRISLLRLLVSGGDILLFDEPLSAVDAQTRLFLQQELLDLWSISPKTSVYVTHDIEEALTLGDRVIVMAEKGGRILADIPVTTPRPRRATARKTPDIEALRWEIWAMLARTEPKYME